MIWSYAPFGDDNKNYIYGGILMKKTLAILFILVITLSACISVNAAVSAFSGEIPTNANTEFHDVGGKKAGGWVSDEFGIGNTEPGDYVVFRKIDFGAKGASKAIIRFSFLITEYSPLPCTMEMYIDSIKGTPVASFNIENCYHWIADASMNFSSDCSIKSGVHDVYVKWKDNTGSLFAISFKEKTGTASSSSSSTVKPTAPAATSKPASTQSSAAGNVTTSATSSTIVSGSVSSTISSEAATSSEISSKDESVAESAVESVSESTPNDDKDADPKGSSPWGFVIAGAAVVAVAAAVVVFVMKKKKA